MKLPAGMKTSSIPIVLVTTAPGFGVGDTAGLGEGLGEAEFVAIVELSGVGLSDVVPHGHQPVFKETATTDPATNNSKQPITISKGLINEPSFGRSSGGTSPVGKILGL